MRLNFAVVDHVVLEGEFGPLDVHNAFDMVGLKHDMLARRIAMSFCANQYALPGAPRSFTLTFDGATVVRADPPVLASFHVDEISPAPKDDLDYDYTYTEAVYEEAEWDLLVRGTSGEVMRVAADFATVSL